MTKETINQGAKANIVEPSDSGRFNIAKLVLLFGLVAVAILGIVAIYYTAKSPDYEKAFTNIKDILTMVLPLIGAWVGTVLAFYFSKENFKAASDSTKDLYTTIKSTSEKLKNILATEVMIKVEAMTKLILNKDEKDIKLKADIIDGIMEKDKNKPFNRLPVLSDKMYPVYIIHRSLFDKFFVKKTLEAQNNANPAVASKKIEELTLADLTGDDEFKKMLTQSFGTISASSDLAAIKNLIDTDPNCQDVFITESGNRDSKVVGWITNVIIAQASVI